MNKKTHKNNVLYSLGFVVTVINGLSGCGYQTYCAKIEECSEQKLGDEFQEVCVIENEGLLEEYRANEEEICQELATAKEEMDLCRLDQECKDFNNAAGGETCQDKVKRFEDLLLETLVTCSQLD
tara:strand:- start:18 stop:392 length:375 start_codon:yes stop_codon:yes gene_type:complete